MKIIFKIAKNELRNLFYSPIAWFLMVVFMIQCAAVYHSSLEIVASNLEFTDTLKQSITDWVYLTPFSLFPKIMGTLYLYIPLLTMSLISREINSGTIKLLYSSPINVFQIVLGKYLAMLIYSLVLVLIISIFCFAGIKDIQNAQWQMLAGAVLGLFLLLAVYSAIGLFMSSLTTYQVVAALSTFVMIGLLQYIGDFWQNVDFFREITYFLSISGRTDDMTSGLISTKDIVYFLVIIYMFLLLTVLKLKSHTESKPFFVRLLRYFGVVGSGLVIGYIFSISSIVKYFDVTFDSKRTLTPNVQKIIAGFGDKPLKVTAYANLLDNNFYLGSPFVVKEFEDRWENYVRFKNDIDLSIVRYYDKADFAEGSISDKDKKKSLKEQAERYAKVYNTDMEDVLTPNEIKKQIDLSSEGNRYVMKLEWNGRSTFLRVFNDMAVWPSETEVAAAFLRLQQAHLPKIVFLTGDLERDFEKSGDRNYQFLANFPTFRYSLVNQGFDVQKVNLDTEEIPLDATTLVLSDPRAALSLKSIAKIKKYIEEGRNILIATEPVGDDKSNLLKPILDDLGVSVKKGLLIQESSNNTPDFVEGIVQKSAVPFYKKLVDVVKADIKTTMPGAAALEYSKDGKFDVVELIKTDGIKSWNRLKPFDVKTALSAKVKPSLKDSLGVINYSEKDGDELKSFATVLGLKRKVGGREQRIVVAGDADFLSNKELMRNETSNFFLGTGLFRWMSNDDFPVDTFRPEAKDNKLSLDLAALGRSRFIYQWCLPFILLAAGAVILIRRKRK